MKYYIDTEFIEETQNKTFLGFNIGKTKPTIDLISIGIVAEDGREYYAISKDFNLKEAWNRFDVKPDIENGGTKKVYWIRENVLKSIFDDLLFRMQQQNKKVNGGTNTNNIFELSNMKYLLDIFGKNNNGIAKEVQEFCGKDYVSNSPEYQDKPLYGYTGNTMEGSYKKEKPTFYAYYADYDWVVFCWLFGKMNDLPNGFPYYCRDLKQIADNIWETTGKDTRFESPKGEHNALVDARWNKDFHNFLKSL